MTTRNILFALAVLQCGWSGALAESLYTLPEGVDTRWASAENPLGEKGKAAQTNGAERGDPRYRSRLAHKSHWQRFAGLAVRYEESGQQSATEALPCSED